MCVCMRVCMQGNVCLYVGGFNLYLDPGLTYLNTKGQKKNKGGTVSQNAKNNMKLRQWGIWGNTLIPTPGESKTISIGLFPDKNGRLLVKLSEQ